MLDVAVVLVRLMQYGAASILAGSALFFVYALPVDGSHSAIAYRWAKPLLTISALALAVAALLGLVAQTAVMAGSIAAGLQAEVLIAVLSGTSLGKAAVVRAAFACAAAVLLLVMRPGRTLWALTAVLGSLAAATLAWMGHGSATEGDGYLPHLVADVLHSLAAAVWIGALAAFVFLIKEREPTPEHLETTHSALHRFSSVGLVLVITLAITGLMNVWYIVGFDVETASRTAYGKLLVLKLLLFVGMLAFAALHRQRSVPALGRDLSSGAAAFDGRIGSLQRSLLVEATLGFGVLALVAWLGTLPPPSVG
jgi:putative copper resistance protein D